MRVGVITSSFPRYEGDYAGIFVYDLLRKISAKGVDFHVIAPHTPGTSHFEVLNGIQIHRFGYFWPPKYQRLAYGSGVPINLRKSWLANFQILPFILSILVSSSRYLSDCDIIHAHWIESGLIGLILSKLYGMPVAISVHRDNAVGPIGEYINRYVLNKADYVFFNSSYTYRRASNITGDTLGSVIPPAVDTDKFFPKWRAIDEQPNYVNRKKFTILGVGSLIPRKGFIHLIDAIPEILDNFDCQFIFGGDGPERKRLIDRATDLEIHHKVSLLGQVSTSDMPNLMRQADIFVLPSIPTDSGENEPLGMVLVEALASGTPCVASRTGGIVDIIEDGVDGYLVAPGNSKEIALAIMDLLKNPGLRLKMGKAGRRKVKDRFSLDVISARVLKLYHQLLDI